MAILCKYTYDPLDRVSTLTPLAQAVSNRFYNGEQLMTELQCGRQRTCIRAGGQLLAQQSREGDEVVTTMIAGDRSNSVLHVSEDGRPVDIAYTPFGHHQAGQTIADLPGFNGEQPDPVTGHYLLGNGYRAYNPVLMRFNSPDSMSPFGRGGLNAYAYCVGDPVNRVDPTGHLSWVKAGIGLLALSIFGTGLASLATINTAPEASKILGGIAIGAVGVTGIALGFRYNYRAALKGVGNNMPGRPGPSSVVYKAAPKAGAGFGDLPEEVMTKIMNDLSGRDIRNLAHTSRGTRSAVERVSRPTLNRVIQEAGSREAVHQKILAIARGQEPGISPGSLKYLGLSGEQVSAEIFRDNIRSIKDRPPMFGGLTETSL
ncbi:MULTISPECIES: RHS repeat-associated core domain-containing protein [Pseudomonas]|uniref:RHS repeat-associated core domain-containing protein n=1 Tax=Pseudomonas TaxID=286 RepID=UPI000AC130CC|nr:MULTISPECIES: RHS repeat-associated core domain-containing protein [Pseudomonas]MBP1119320.1 RHS repeat-associated protein [Pseudomonas sp. PvP028]MBS7417872.1 RHS repeat-associated core domain-containing protein [Pseudomonas syringae]MBS7435996.1 RHS repeat-associated core domain-containing protein [Pseudomonas syringae]MBS7460506.1 RHS repeat-associated core domain-containing protein [Pseudomonas syringae]QVI70819.1 RHS repeat-associated core domain-containing protein [Pseudomonas syringa